MALRTFTLVRVLVEILCDLLSLFPRNGSDGLGDNASDGLGDNGNFGGHVSCRIVGS